MDAYLDNSATTFVFDSVKEIMVKTMTEDFGNPSSLHRKGMEAENYIKQARERIATQLKVDPKELLFTSGGTESNNIALLGGAMANRRAGNHIITTQIEHASVSAPVRVLEEQGFEVTFLPVNQEGVVELSALRQALRRDTILVSVMYVNNEIGSVQPISQIAGLIRECSPSALLHVDAIQGFGKYIIRPRKEGIDLLSVSGHKIHGPKGSGFLYIRDRVKVRPIVFGGGQQQGMRSGTENVPAIAGLGQAVWEIYQDHEARVERLYQLKEKLTEGLRLLPGTVINGPAVREGAPHIVSVSFENVRAEVLLHALEDRGIYVSAGSACSSNHASHSQTLEAIGVKRELLESTLRFSLSIFNTEEEIAYTVAVLSELLPVLSRYRRA